MRLGGLWAAGIVALPGVALAQSTPPTPRPVASALQSVWAERPFAGHATLGLATPLGLGGLSLEYAPIRYVSLGGGVGMNLEGPQLAAFTRLRFTPNKPLSIFVGGGYTRGPHRQTQLTAFGTFVGAAVAFRRLVLDDWRETVPPERYWSAAHWLNLELGAETRKASGFDLRAFIGVATLLNPSNNVLQQPYAESRRDDALDVVPFTIYSGAALGFAL